jgi:hypothetical protein
MWAIPDNAMDRRYRGMFFAHIVGSYTRHREAGCLRAQR